MFYGRDSGGRGQSVILVNKVGDESRQFNFPIATVTGTLFYCFGDLTRKLLDRNKGEYDCLVLNMKFFR